MEAGMVAEMTLEMLAFHEVFLAPNRDVEEMCLAGGDRSQFEFTKSIEFITSNPFYNLQFQIEIIN